jgi:8-oxo-dGTP pyrophosphatase MutT (NUDIX family)
MLPAHHLAGQGFSALIDAAVLVPIILRPAGSMVLLTRRADHLRNHPGQISFPGGRREDSDPDAVATALRELTEELNISANEVRIVGCLEEHLTGSGFRITPVVGVMQPPNSLRPNDDEVAEVFEVPLAYVLNEAHYELTGVKQGTSTRSYFVLEYAERRIWGATAGILYRLVKKTNSNTEFERTLKGLS